MLKSNMLLKLSHRKVNIPISHRIFIRFLIETSQALVPNHRPSFLRRIISDVVLAGIIAFAYKIFQRWFRSVGDVPLPSSILHSLIETRIEN